MINSTDDVQHNRLVAARNAVLDAWAGAPYSKHLQKLPAFTVFRMIDDAVDAVWAAEQEDVEGSKVPR